MTPLSQNVAIAILCKVEYEARDVCPRCRGVTPYEAGDDYGLTIWEKCKNCKNTGKVETYYVGLPNYTGDLNACYEMEKVIWNLGKWNDYVVFLEKLSNFIPIRATAAQRCEAFLRVFNKWLE